MDQSLSVGDTNWSDYEIEMTTMMNGSQFREISWLKSYIYFRETSENDYYRFGVHGDAKILELSKMVKGEWSQLASYTYDAIYHKWVTFSVSVKGPDIKCYADGKLVCQATDTSLARGYVSIGARDNGMLNAYRHIVIRRVN